MPGARLERGEEVAVEAAAVGKRLVRLRPAVGEDGIGEVVVLVDQHVQRDALLRSVSEQIVQLAVDPGMREDAVDHRLREQILVILQRIAQRDEAVVLEPLAQGFEGVVERGKVEAQDHVAVAVRRGLARDVGAAEDFLEASGAVAVVVALQQRHPARFAEAAGPDQERESLAFQLVQEAGLVDVQRALATHRLEVGPAVRYLRIRGAHCHSGLRWTNTLSSGPADMR